MTEPAAAARSVLGYAGLTIAVESSDPRDLAWLREFLCPWFADSAGGADCSATLVGDDAAFEAARALGRRAGAEPAPAFVADGAPLALEPWNAGETGPLHYDRAGEAFFLVAPDRRSCRVLARRGRRFARVAWMRAVREFATEHLARAGRPLLHAAAVSVEGRAVAFAGARRSGKTSCLLHALRAPGAGFVANDRVAVLPAAGGSARGMPTIVRLRRDSLCAHPGLAPRLGAVDLRVSDALGEDAADQPVWPRPDGSLGLSPAQFLDRIGAAPVAEAPLAAIALPWLSRSPGSFELTRLPPEEAARRLPAALLGGGHPAPQTLFAAPGADRAASAAAVTRACAELAHRVACFDLRLDLDAYAEGPDRLLDGLLAPCR